MERHKRKDWHQSTRRSCLKFQVTTQGEPTDDIRDFIIESLIMRHACIPRTHLADRARDLDPSGTGGHRRHRRSIFSFTHQRDITFKSPIHLPWPQYMRRQEVQDEEEGLLVVKEGRRRFPRLRLWQRSPQ
jgi:hypothetical protein